ncbi:hypothetical protein [Halomicronema sp. CCY15110]|nr:hypothetical protein [Halomicronema sp. CCY15110]
MAASDRAHASQLHSVAHFLAKKMIQGHGQRCRQCAKNGKTSLRQRDRRQ